jgi:hypothetical protein
MNVAALVHGMLKAEGMVAGRCINTASQPDPAWLHRAMWHPIWGNNIGLFFDIINRSTGLESHNFHLCSSKNWIAILCKYILLFQLE